jgi:putative ABC transport system permease protein
MKWQNYQRVLALMMFSNLSSSLIAHQYDLAVLRVLGASPATIFSTVLFEGALIGFVGAVIGIVLGHAATYIAVATVPSLQAMMIPMDMLKFQIQDLYFIALGLLSGCFATVLPARKALKIDIAALLAKGHS